MRDRHGEKRRAIEAAVLRGPAHTTSALREAVARGRVTERNDVPEELRALVDKVHDHAHRVTDADIDALRGRYDEDRIFEIVVAAAVGAARHRLEAGLRALALVEAEES
jgi:hypothetical protein